MSLGRYGNFLFEVMNNVDAAEEMYTKVLQVSVVLSWVPSAFGVWGVWGVLFSWVLCSVECGVL